MPALVRRPGRQRDGPVVVARGRPFCAPQATAPQIRSAVRRFELERWGWGTRRALVGYRGERPLSRGEPGDGLATRRFSWIDERSSRALMAALWPLAAGHLLGMLVVMLPFAFLDALVEWHRFDPEWRQPPGDRVRYLAARQPPPSAGAGANTTDAVRTLVLPRGNCSWGVGDRPRPPRPWEVKAGRRRPHPKP